MICAWWDHKGIIYYEFLLQNQTIDSGVYCRNLANLIQNTKQFISNTKRVLFQQDNARQHVHLAIRTRPRSLAPSTIFHQSAPSDYPLFLSLPNSLQEKTSRFRLPNSGYSTIVQGATQFWKESQTMWLIRKLLKTQPHLRLTRSHLHKAVIVSELYTNAYMFTRKPVRKAFVYCSNKHLSEKRWPI